MASANTEDQHICHMGSHPLGKWKIRFYQTPREREIILKHKFVIFEYVGLNSLHNVDINNLTTLSNWVCAYSMTGNRIPTSEEKKYMYKARHPVIVVEMYENDNINDMIPDNLNRIRNWLLRNYGNTITLTIQQGSPN